MPPLLRGLEDTMATIRCTCCDKPLRGTPVMLELDQRVGEYHDNGDVPEDWSQGWFPFGSACAENARDLAREAFQALEQTVELNDPRA